MSDLTLLKLGGSLITDKSRPDTDRPEVIARLAGEIAGALPGLGGALVVGHGSGSFGHVAAERHGVHRGLAAAPLAAGRLAGVSLTQAKAAELHRRVVAALLDAGAAPFSVAPSSALVAAAGRPARFGAEPVALALDAGLLPVVYGDVVMDRDQGSAICSTEAVFTALAEALPEHGLRVRRALWLGETEGIYDAAGRPVPRLSPAAAGELLPAVGGSAGTDVTGGMAHRLETALELARCGVTSWVGDGRVPGLLARALAGEEVSGTWVTPTAPG